MLEVPLLILSLLVSFDDASPFHPLFGPVVLYPVVQEIVTGTYGEHSATENQMN